MLATLVAWFGNTLVLVGVLYLAVEVYLTKQLARMRHVESGQPIPANNFFMQMGNFFARAFGLWPDFNPLEYLLEMRRSNGPIYVYWTGWKPLVVVAEPEAIRQVLNDREEVFTKGMAFGTNPTAPRVMGASLINVSGHKWKSQRKAMEPAFQYKKMRTLVPLFTKCTQKLIDKWAKASYDFIQVEEGLTALTLDAIGLGAFSYDFGAVEGRKETSENLAHYHGIMGAMFRPLTFIFPFITKLPTRHNRELNQRIYKFQAFLYHVITTHRKGERKNEDLDLLDHIISMDEEGQLTNEEISHNLFLFFLAGHDTSSSALTSALYFLAKSPEMQQRAFNEVSEVLGDKRQPNFSDLAKLEYLNMFLKETLRLRSPVSGTTYRTVQKEEGITLSNYHLPKGTAITPSIWGYHYDERYWPDAYSFKPERWEKQPNSNDGDGEPSHDLLTFSMGPRIWYMLDCSMGWRGMVCCNLISHLGSIGKKFAMTEMMTVLAMMLQNFEFELPSPGYQWKFRPLSVTIRPADGMPLRIKPRLVAHEH